MKNDKDKANDVTSKSSTRHSTGSKTMQHDNSNILLVSETQMTKEIINVKVSDDKSLSFISSICFLPGGELVVCDNANHKTKLLDRSLSVLDSICLPDTPLNVAIIDDNDIVATLPYEKQIQFIQVLPSLKLGHTINVGTKCWGVAVAADKIFVSCYDRVDRGDHSEIRVYDIKGKNLGKRLGSYNSN